MLLEKQKNNVYPKTFQGFVSKQLEFTHKTAVIYFYNTL